MARKFERRDFSDVENPKARHYFELYNDLQEVLDEQDWSIADGMPNRMRREVVSLAAGLMHEVAMNLEFGK